MDILLLLILYSQMLLISQMVFSERYFTAVDLIPIQLKIFVRKANQYSCLSCDVLDSFNEEN